MKGALTIGHGRRTFEVFLEMLALAGVELLIDVRSIPYSRFAPWSNRKTIKRRLEGAGIDYLWLGEALGGKRSEPEFLTGGKPDFDKIAGSDVFRAGIERAVELAGARRVCLMCAESDHRKCHRSMLIEPALKERGVALIHLPEGLPGQDDHQHSLW